MSTSSKPLYWDVDLDSSAFVGPIKRIIDENVTKAVVSAIHHASVYLDLDYRDRGGVVMPVITIEGPEDPLDKSPFPRQLRLSVPLADIIDDAVGFSDPEAVSTALQILLAHARKQEAKDFIQDRPARRATTYKKRWFRGVE